jgi:hypothetical protein
MKREQAVLLLCCGSECVSSSFFSPFSSMLVAVPRHGRSRQSFQARGGAAALHMRVVQLAMENAGIWGSDIRRIDTVVFEHFQLQKKPMFLSDSFLGTSFPQELVTFLRQSIFPCSSNNAVRT